MSSDPESGRGREERPEMAHEERSPGSSGSSGETMPPTDEGGADEYETFADASDGGDLERELAEALGGMNLDSLIDLDIPRGGSAATAEAAEGVRHGTVIDVQGDDIFVDMGGKSQGIIAAEQFSDEGIPEPGDEIEVTIEGYDRDEGLLILSRKGAVMAATWRDVEEGQIVEGRVKGHNKGGLELDVDGIKAFMPISQIELFRVEELAPYVNRRLSCQIMEVRRDEKTLVVSRRDLLRREEEVQRQRTFETLVEGQTVRGVVKTIMPYGAFVDIGGIDGLVHIRDLAHRRVEDPKEIVKEGQQIEVMVLKIDREERKIGLGLKQVMPDPWESAGAKWPVDTVISVRVVKLMVFGAFAELEPGVEGLIPVSEMSYGRRISHPKEVVGEGDVVKVRVINLDAESRKIGLSLKQVGDDPWMGASVRWPVDGVVEGKVTRLAEFGAFVELAPGVEGLIHISELSDGHVRSASEVVREGQAVEAKVLEVDEERRRIGLSLKALKLDPNYTGEASGGVEAPRTPKKRKKPLKGGLDW